MVTLKLDNNDVGDAGALAAALARGHALGTLWLRGNARIGAAGASALAAAEARHDTRHQEERKRWVQDEEAKHLEASAG